jgi:hypothetical protein
LKGLLQPERSDAKDLYFRIFHGSAV